MSGVCPLLLLLLLLLLAGEVNANLLGHPFPHTTLRIHEFEEVSAEMLRPI